jgi:hypothetical protein
VSGLVADDLASGIGLSFSQAASVGKGPGGGRVEPDTVAAPFHGQRHRHGVQRRLRHGRRYDEGRPGPNPGDEIADHRAFEPARDPAFSGRKRDVEAAIHHRRRDGAKPSRTEILGRSNEIGGRVVDEAGQRTLGPNPVHHCLDLIGVPDVADMRRRRLRSVRRNLGGGVLERLGASSADMHFRALRRERLPISLPRPPPPPVTSTDLPFSASSRKISMLIMARPWT